MEEHLYLSKSTNCYTLLPTNRNLRLGSSERLRVLPQCVTKQSGVDIREERGSYTREDELIGSRRVGGPGDQVSVATPTINQKHRQLQKGGSPLMHLCT